ncbi:MAG: prepilin-type N-terminal cleavage/methylation domain-containing protein [Candidatus Magasanikbacteria bacterium]|nr:prepilin-type N-terminal cleavage/methylation domain-containing protein [Candidatus Magasanikbacteria bacterium]
MKNDNLKYKKGFTLLEVLVSIGIFMLIITAVTSFIGTIFSSNNVIYNQLTAQKEARRVMEDFVKEVRNASASSIGSYLISAASATSFTFYSDIDNDSYAEKIRYFVSNSTFKKGVTKPTGNPLTYNPASEVITDIVHDMTAGQQPFLYFNKNYTGTGVALSFPVNILDIRVVQLSLTIDQKPSFSPLPITVSSKVEIRNLKYAD